MIRKVLQKQAGGSKRRAAILVLTLWIVVVLGLISASMLEEVYLELKLAKFQREQLEAMALARAGLARAVADLRNDLLMDRNPLGGDPFDALGDVWARLDEGKLDVPMGKGTYSVWVDDEAAKLNLNTMELNLLRALLFEMGLKEKEAQQVAAAILDWRDPDDLALPPGVGKEDEYYSALAAKRSRQRWDKGDPPIYRCKNDRFSSVDELLSVAHVTPELFYGVDIEEETPPSPIEQLKQRTEREAEKRRRERQRGLRDVLTVDSQGAVNLNTADRFVLQVLFRATLGNSETAASMAEKILQLRKPDARGNYRNENALRKIEDLVQLLGLDGRVLTALQRVAPLTVRSNTYRINALGERRDDQGRIRAQHLICALVARSYETLQPDQLTALFEKGVVNTRLIDDFQRRHRDRREPIEQATVRVVRWWEL